MSERVAVVGARNHPNLDLVREYVRSLPDGTVVVSGGADGVDTAAREAAIACKLLCVEYVPTESRVVLRKVWREAANMPDTSDAYGIGSRNVSTRDVLLFRNTMIAVACTRAVVFPDGSRGGCWDLAREAIRFGRVVEARWCNGRMHPLSSKRFASQEG